MLENYENVYCFSIYIKKTNLFIKNVVRLCLSRVEGAFMLRKYGVRDYGCCESASEEYVN